MIFIKLLDEKKIKFFFFSPVSDQERSNSPSEISLCVFSFLFHSFFFFLTERSPHLKNVWVIRPHSIKFASLILKNGI